MLSRSLRDRLSDLIRQGVGASEVVQSVTPEGQHAAQQVDPRSNEPAPGQVDARPDQTGANSHVSSQVDITLLAPGQVATVNGGSRRREATERRVVPTGIEELLPGGVISNPHGSLFIHERLYTDLGEEPGPVLERFDSLSRLDVGADCPVGDRQARTKRHRGGGVAQPSGNHAGRNNGYAHNGNGHHADRVHFGYGDEDQNGDGDRYNPALEPRVVYEMEPTVIQPFLPTMEAQVEWPERGLFRRFGYRKMLFLDLETCGLSGCPVFLAGVALMGEGDVVLRQLFARDYAEERALLAEVGRLMDEADFLVTFNGKTFDVPFLRDRAIHHRMQLPFSIPHLDLVWMVRRRWKRQLPDCKLKTLEWRVLRRRRAGDVWGYEIPGLYHDYVQNGQPHRLIPIFHHNMLDVVAMVELIPAVFDPETTVY